MTQTAKKRLSQVLALIGFILIFGARFRPVALEEGKPVRKMDVVADGGEVRDFAGDASAPRRWLVIDDASQLPAQRSADTVTICAGKRCPAGSLRPWNPSTERALASIAHPALVVLTADRRVERIVPVPKTKSSQ